MTRIDLTALRTLAQSATPGPWAIEPHPYGNSPARSIHVADRDADEFPVVSQLGCGCCDVGLDADAEDLSYIAAANPATVLRLIDALEAVLDRARMEQDDAEYAMTYAAEIDDGPMLVSQQARKQAWADAARALATALKETDKHTYRKDIDYAPDGTAWSWTVAECECDQPWRHA